MFSFLAPGYIKQAIIILKNARKLLHYKRDTLGETSVAGFQAQIDKLQDAVNRRDEPAVQQEASRLETLWSSFMPPVEHAAWRENCEVFLVAIVIAIGVRTYFIQPFTIPTGSMQPTLNGIIAYSTGEPAPNILTRVWQFAILGRNYVDVVAKADDTVLGMTEKSPLPFFTYTDVECDHSHYTIFAPPKALREVFKMDIGRKYTAGEVIARGYVNAGDHVFVDKFSYHFRFPRRGEVFVFKTTGIHEIEKNLPPDSGSQFFIKRLAGLPGDSLRIASPNLYINGALAQGVGFAKVMSETNGYKGYQEVGSLSDPDSTVHLMPGAFFALGDNSYNSLDSRYWGKVPQENIMGDGLFVYWPFTSHWGLIR